VRATVNGRAVLARVETGSARSLLDFQGATQMRVAPVSTSRDVETGQARLTAMPSPSPAGPLEDFAAVARSMKLGDLVIYQMEFGILNDAEGFGRHWWLGSPKPDAVIGNDVLSSFTRVTLDFPRANLALHSGGRYRPDPERLIAALPLEREQGLPALKALVDTKGPVLVVVATGADVGLWIPRGMAGSLGLPGQGDLPEPRPPAGRSGAADSAPVAPTLLNISGFELADVPTEVGTIDRGEREPPFAFLGNRILRDYVLSIDYGAGKIYFELP
jgi:hypothetical protein